MRDIRMHANANHRRCSRIRFLYEQTRETFVRDFFYLSLSAIGFREALHWLSNRARLLISAGIPYRVLRELKLRRGQIVRRSFQVGPNRHARYVEVEADNAPRFEHLWTFAPESHFAQFLFSYKIIIYNQCIPILLAEL